MNGQRRENVKIGSEVKILTGSAFHHRGIKVRGQEYQEGLI